MVWSLVTILFSYIFAKHCHPEQPWRLQRFMFLLLYVQLFCNAGDNYIQRNIMQAYVILFFTSMIAGRPLIVSLVDDEGCEVKLVQRSVPSHTSRKDWTVLGLLISSMIRKELGHQYAVVAAGNSRAVTTTAVGKGRHDHKGFREALTTLAAGAGCRDQGGSTTFFTRRQRVGEEVRPRERRSRDRSYRPRPLRDM